MTTQERIYNYFEREQDLRVLFVFDRMTAIASELCDAVWPDDYVYHEFDGRWFTLKHKLANDWADKRVVLIFDESLKPDTEQKRQDFLVLDILAANCEFRQDNWEEYIQRFNIPAQYAGFVRANIQELMGSKVSAILMPHLQGGDFTDEKAIRAFLSAYLGEKKLLDWETIVVKLILLDVATTPADKKRATDFYTRINRNRTARERLDAELMAIFGFSYEPNKLPHMQHIAESLKYNSITQTLGAVSADTYKSLKIESPLALERMNRIYDRGMDDVQLTERFSEAVKSLATQIREEEIINVYGTDATYFHFTEALCIPILKKIASGALTENPEQAVERVRELSLRLHSNSRLSGTVAFIETVGAFLLKSRSLGAMQFATPAEYVSFYTEHFCVVDRLYREVVRLSNGIKIIPEFEKVAVDIRRLIDADYSRLANILNLEWMNAVKKSAQLFDATGLPKQESFFKDNRTTKDKKLAVIISDALRYEMGLELLELIGGTKHVATISPMLTMLPTETKYCKQALLPHSKLTLSNDKLLIDGKSLSSKEERDVYLKALYPDSICLNYEDLMSGNRTQKRELLKSKSLVYIFHNTIDRAGHEGNVPEACKQALTELKEVINSLHVTWSYSNVIVTSDHGFLFNDIQFEEKDKHAITDSTIEKKTRYYLTPCNGEVEGVSKFPLNKVSGIMTTDIIEVAVPDGTNRFAAPGGYQFAHGGASLQEMIVPVIHSRQQRVDKTEKVGVALMDHNLNMVSSRLKLRLIQSDPVTMTCTERTVCCQVFDGDKGVTDVKEVKLDSTDATNLNNRLFEITLRQTESGAKSTLQLRVWDKDEPLNPLVTAVVKNNTIIEQDF